MEGLWRAVAGDSKVEAVAVPRVVGRDGHCVLAGVPEPQDVDAVVLAGGEGNCLSRGDRLGSAEKLNMGGAVITAPRVGASCLGSSLGPPPAPVIARRARLRSSSAQIFCRSLLCRRTEARLRAGRDQPALVRQDDGLNSVTEPELCEQA